MKEEVKLEITTLLRENLHGGEHKNLDYLYSTGLIRIKGEADKEVIMIHQNSKVEVVYLEINLKKIILEDNSINLLKLQRFILKHHK